MANNESKYYEFVNGLKLYAVPGAGQDLSTGIQKPVADELDAIIAECIGHSVAAAAFPVTPASGLAVTVGVGVGFVAGQRLCITSPVGVSGLPPSQTGVKIYLEAEPPWLPALRAWTTVARATQAALTSSQLLLALVDTSGSGVTSVVDQRVYFGSLSLLSAARQPTSGEKAALAGSSGAPGDSNRYVTQSDSAMVSLPEVLAYGAI